MPFPFRKSTNRARKFSNRRLHEIKLSNLLALQGSFGYNISICHLGKEASP